MREEERSYKHWLANCSAAEQTLLRSLSEQEIREYFYADLEFGTEGMRGILRLGRNGMNKYTVARATQGLADYIKAQGQQKKGVVISYDSRHMSREFASVTAQILAHNGIKVYLYDALRPVPLLSFGVRHYGAYAGVMITASHNPKEYNGYKVYGQDGAQLAPDSASEVQRLIERLDFFGIEAMQMQEAVAEGLIKIVGKELDDAYMQAVLPLIRSKEAVARRGAELSVVYTPIHGSGCKPVMRVLREMGMQKVELIAQQAEPDGDFSTVASPNPENREALELAIARAKEIGATLVLGTDPDCDRMGAAVLNEQGEFVTLTGNQIACVMLSYLLEKCRQTGMLPQNGVVVKTIVSTELARAIANEYGAALVEVLTGFKFIGEKIKEYEQTEQHTFLFGFEESYGYLEGTHARDKDAVVACMLMCEAACSFAERGKTVYQALQELYEKYGYYTEKTVSYTLSGVEGMEKIAQTMRMLAQRDVREIGGVGVLAVRNYSAGVRRAADGSEQAITLPKSNVLYYELENNQWACVRPSGTEPKIKVYFGTCAQTQEAAQKALAALEQGMKEITGL